MTTIKQIEQLPNFDSWAITDTFWDGINESFKNYDDALDEFEDEDGYHNHDIQLSYIINNPNDPLDFDVHKAPFVY